MKKFKTFLIFSFIMNYLILESGCELNDSHIPDEEFKEFAISNVDNLLNLGHKSKVERAYSTYYTQFTLTNLSQDTFTIVARGTVLPQHSLLIKGGASYTFLNYEHYRDPEKLKFKKFFPKDSIKLTMQVTNIFSLQDSFLYRPELVLNNRRYRLQYMFRKNEDQTGYFLIDSLSNASLMKDTIVDYSNYRIGID